MQTAGSGSDSPSTAIFATLPVTASGHPGNLGLNLPHLIEKWTGLLFDTVKSNPNLGSLLGKVRTPFSDMVFVPCGML